MKAALVPLNATELAPVNAVPVIVTDAPTPPLLGVKPVIVGAGMNVKFVELCAVPPGVVTEMGPVLAPDGTVAVIWVSELKVNVAPTPLNVTAVALASPVPEIVTEVPAPPLVGLKLLMTGGGTTVKLVELVPVPATVVTEMGPVVTPVGALAVICVSESTVMDAAFALLKATVLVAVKPVPEIVTEVPVTPLVGVNDEIVGAPNTSSYAPMSQPACCGRVIPR